jgi:hypothetical protein
MREGSRRKRGEMKELKERRHGTSPIVSKA